MLYYDILSMSYIFRHIISFYKFLQDVTQNLKLICLLKYQVSAG